MKDLETSLTKNGVKVDSLDLGEWDISLGMEKTIFIRNPNTYARADLRGIKNSDERLNVYLPDYINADTTVPVKVRIPGKMFADAIEEEIYFKDIMDKLSGRIIWRTPTS